MHALIMIKPYRYPKFDALLIIVFFGVQDYLYDYAVMLNKKI